jgi:hypothetical protein
VRRVDDHGGSRGDLGHHAVAAHLHLLAADHRLHVRIAFRHAVLFLDLLLGHLEHPRHPAPLHAVVDGGEQQAGQRGVAQQQQRLVADDAQDGIKARIAHGHDLGGDVAHRRHGDAGEDGGAGQHLGRLPRRLRRHQSLEALERVDALGLGPQAVQARRQPHLGEVDDEGHAGEHAGQRQDAEHHLQHPVPEERQELGLVGRGDEVAGLARQAAEGAGDVQQRARQHDGHRQQLGPRRQLLRTSDLALLARFPFALWGRGLGLALVSHRPPGCLGGSAGR